MLIKVVLLLFFAGATQAHYKGDIEYGGHKYAYFAEGHDNVNWYTASVACQSMPLLPRGSTLAMAKTEGIANAINTLLSYYNYPSTWLGANDLYGEGYWVWVDGTPLRKGYTSWNSGEPNNVKNEDCMLVGKGWNDYGCEHAMGYVCQIPLTRAVPSDYSELTSEEQDCDEKQFGFICEIARPSTLKVSDEQPEVTEDGDLEIDCSASGVSLPDVAWYRDEELISDQSIGAASSTLFIKNAAQSDAGKYICVATNTINGRTSKVMRISDVSVVADGN